MPEVRIHKNAGKWEKARIFSILHMKIPTKKMDFPKYGGRGTFYFNFNAGTFLITIQAIGSPPLEYQRYRFTTM